MKKKSKAASSRSERRRQLIVAAAVRHFMQNGYAKASLEEIATEAGVSRPALYHHFASKAELFRAVASHIHERVIDKITALAKSDLPIEDCLWQMLTVKSAEVHESMWHSPYGNEIFDESNRRCADLATQYRQRFSRQMANVLGRANLANEIDLGKILMSPQAAGAFLFFGAEGLHERFTGKPVSPDLYRTRLRVLVRCFVAGVAR